jgi:hypothetical protein
MVEKEKGSLAWKINRPSELELSLSSSSLIAPRLAERRDCKAGRELDSPLE